MTSTSGDSMRRAIGLLVFVGLTSGATSARADERSEQAERLFDEAKDLVKQGKAEQACPRFEESQKLDPAVGTQFNLADCYEKIGKFASAYRSFTDLQATLMRVGDPRTAKAAERVAALEGRVPKLEIDVPWAAKVEGLVVQLDDRILEPAQIGAPLPVDPGAHRIVVRADRKQPFSKDVIAQVATAQTVAVPELTEEAARVVVVEKPSNGTRTLAIVVGAAGVAALGTGIVLGIVAKGNYDDAVKDCSDASSDTPHCRAGSGAVNAADSAKSLATVGTVVGAVGVAAVIAGVVLWVVSPKSTKSVGIDASSVLRLKGTF
jgi:hypothetical protein